MEPGAARHGGFGEVHAARDERGRRVAIKLGWDPEVLEEERRSLAAAQGVDGVVCLLDQGRTEQRPFVVLPWYERSLSGWDAPLAERLGALDALVATVIRLHRSASALDQVVVHGDIKPSNVLLRRAPGDTWQLALSDLGATREGRLFGREPATPYSRFYGPPEQQVPLPRPLDTRVDVHALGVTAYEVLAGRLPDAVLQRSGLFTARAREVRQQVQNGEAVPPVSLAEVFDLAGASALLERDEARLRAELRDLSPERGESLAAVLLPALRDALQPDPSRRPRVATPLLAAIREAREALPQAVVVAGLPPTRPALGARWALPLAVGATLLAAAWAWNQGGTEVPQSPDPLRVAQAPVETRPPQATPELANDPAPVAGPWQPALVQAAPPSTPAVADPPPPEDAMEDPDGFEATIEPELALRVVHDRSAALDVLVDDRPAARDLRVSAGLHHVRIEASGQRPCQGDVVLRPDHVRVRCTAAGQLVVE